MRKRKQYLSRKDKVIALIHKALQNNEEPDLLKVHDILFHKKESGILKTKDGYFYVRIQFEKIVHSVGRHKTMESAIVAKIQKEMDLCSDFINNYIITYNGS